MRKSSIILITTGVIIGVILIWWQLLPVLLQEELKVAWTTEAEEYDEKWAVKVYVAIDAPGPLSLAADAKTSAEEIANQTDLIVHLIDMRVGMALPFWIASQPELGGPLAGRYSWSPGFGVRTAWDRLTEGEGLAGVVLQVDWDIEAVIYYYNPGDLYYGVPDQPDVMVEVLRLEAGEDRAQFRDMVANATTKAEELASATDKVVHLDDLREAIAIILYQYNKYPTLEEARTGLAAREQEIGYTPPP